MSDKPPGAQDNTARESGVQYITQSGDINVYPPGGPAQESGEQETAEQRGKGRFAKRPVLLSAAAVVTAAATAITLALLPSSPARTSAAGGSTRAAAGAPAHSAPPVPAASPKASADSVASSAPERPESGVAPSVIEAPGRPDPNLKEEAAPQPRTAVRQKSWSDESWPDGTVCAVKDLWTPVPGMTGIEFQACTYAKSYSGKALFGVKVRNTSNRQVAVAALARYRMTEQEHDCSPPFLQDHVVIDPGQTWSSQLTKCIETIKGAHRVQARAGVSEEGGKPSDSRLEYSGGIDILADGRAVPVRYPN